MTHSSAQIVIKPSDAPAQYDMKTSEDNPCLSCGACCQHFRISFYCGETEDHPGGWVPSSKVIKLNPVMACMQGTEMGGGKCVALIGTPGEPGIGCSIYKNRPSPCREYPVWMEDGSPNPDCQRLRQKIGLAPLPHQAAIEA